MTKTAKYKWGIGLSLLAAIVYLFVPTDIVPDMMPVLGWIDDIIAVLLALSNAIRLGLKIRRNKTADK